MNITMLVGSIFLNLTKIISDRNNPFYSRNTFLIKIMKILFYRYADKLILQTNKVKEYYWFVSKKKIFIINNFFSEKFSKKTKYILKKKIKFLVVSKIEKQKGLEILIGALTQIKKKHNFKCDIYGKGSMQTDIKNLIIKNHLSNLIFIKKPKNLSNVYKKYDLYILSSYYEGYPNSLVEAMITGLPVISSSCDYGPREIISDKKNGVLFNVGSKSDLIKKIELMLYNYKFASKLGNEAKNIYKPSEINKKNLNKWLNALKQ
jgi:glycosyltransferase involved in cell wall biosynthesis